MKANQIKILYKIKLFNYVYIYNSRKKYYSENINFIIFI